MSAGSLTKPEQFVIVDDNTVRVDFAKERPAGARSPISP